MKHHLQRHLRFHPWTAAALPCILVLTLAAPLPARTFDVGPDREFTAIGQVPWESLAAGDTVRIHWRAEPYREKWVISAAGTAEAPVTVSGVPEPDGQLPVIDGANATTRRELDFWGEDRAVIKIGGATVPADTKPSHIVVENLDIRGARPPNSFIGRTGRTAYRDNAAAIWIESGAHIVIRNCTLRDSANGLFSSQESSDLLIEHCGIHGNGIELSIYQHNVYTESAGIIFQFNHFGPLRKDAFGNNLKDRSAGTVIRHNWIEGGNRLLDLVESEYPHITTRADYRQTFVYGNVLVKLPDTANNQIIHYGGDQDDTTRYRNGTLYLVHNTIISRRRGAATLLTLRSPNDVAIVRNNILWSQFASGSMRPMASPGNAYFGWNWCPRPFESMMKFLGEAEGIHVESGKVYAHIPDSRDGKVIGHGTFFSGQIIGEHPGFRDAAAGDYRLAPDSPCIGTAGPLPDAMLPEHAITTEYVPHRRQRPRPVTDAMDIGAFGHD